MRLQALSLTAALVALCGCVTTPPQSARQSVYAIEAEFAAALTVAVAYHDLPTCGPGVSPVCSDPGVKAKVAMAASAANLALNAAEDAVREDPNNLTAMSAAALAVRTMVAITQTLQVR